MTIAHEHNKQPENNDIMLSKHVILDILTVFADHGITVGDFMNALLTEPALIPPATLSIQKSLAEQALPIVQVCIQEIAQLSTHKTGFHFLTSQTEVQQLKKADIMKMAGTMKQHAPIFWHLLGSRASMCYSDFIPLSKM